MRGAAIVAILFVLSACGGGGDDDDVAPDAAIELGCATDLVTDTTFPIDPGGSGTQIHAAAVTDGRTIWVAYNAPTGDGSGQFDVFALGLHCDGTQAVPPFRVNTTTGRNDVDPAIARGDAGELAVVWQSDDGTGVDNLDIFYRLLDADGAPSMPADRILETTHAGAPVPGVAWMPAVAPIAGGGWAIAGSRALDDAGVFQAFVQRLDAAGELVGEAIDGAFEPGVTQTNPTIAARPGGGHVVAWTRSPTTEEDRVVHGMLDAGATSVQPAPPPFAVAGNSDGAEYRVDSAGTAYLALTSAGGDVALLDASTAPFGGQLVTLGVGGRIDHSPSVATAAPGRGAVIWYRNVSGFRNEVVVQAFAYDGASFALGAEQLLGPDDAPPYRPAIAHVRDDVYFVAWSEGISPDFTIQGRFVDLAGAQP